MSTKIPPRPKTVKISIILNQAADNTKTLAEKMEMVSRLRDAVELFGPYYGDITTSLNGDQEQAQALVELNYCLHHVQSILGNVFDSKVSITHHTDRAYNATLMINLPQPV